MTVDDPGDIFDNTIDNGVHEVVEEDEYTEESEEYAQKFLESVSSETGNLEGRFGEEAVFYNLKNDKPVLVTYNVKSISLYGDQETVNRTRGVLTSDNPRSEYVKNRAGVEKEAVAEAVSTFGGLFED
jgi:hypothetical protein